MMVFKVFCGGAGVGFYGGSCRGLWRFLWWFVVVCDGRFEFGSKFSVADDFHWCKYARVSMFSSLDLARQTYLLFLLFEELGS